MIWPRLQIHNCRWLRQLRHNYMCSHAANATTFASARHHQHQRFTGPRIRSSVRRSAFRRHKANAEAIIPLSLRPSVPLSPGLGHSPRFGTMPGHSRKEGAQ